MIRLLVSTAVLGALLAGPALAQVDLPDDPVARGLAIAQESDRRGQGFGDSSAEMRMILRNAQGEESVRELRQHILKTCS